jgi:hypothetical protein
MVVNGFVQISVAKQTTLGYVSMAQDSTSFMPMNTAYSQDKCECHARARFAGENAGINGLKPHSRVNLPGGSWYNPPISTNLSQP